VRSGKCREIGAHFLVRSYGQMQSSFRDIIEADRNAPGVDRGGHSLSTDLADRRAQHDVRRRHRYLPISPKRGKKPLTLKQRVELLLGGPLLVDDAMFRQLFGTCPEAFVSYSNL
jgi:hypothetical protein